MLTTVTGGGLLGKPPQSGSNADLVITKSCVVNGESKQVGDTVTVSAADARYLISHAKAVPTATIQVQDAPIKAKMQKR